MIHFIYSCSPSTLVPEDQINDSVFNHYENIMRIFQDSLFNVNYLHFNFWH